MLLLWLGTYGLGKLAFPGNHPENKALLNEVGARNKQWGRGGLVFTFREDAGPKQSPCRFSGGWVDPFCSRVSSSQLKPGKQKPMNGAVSPGARRGL